VVSSQGVPATELALPPRNFKPAAAQHANAKRSMGAGSVFLETIEEGADITVGDALFRVFIGRRPAAMT
jgi:hypothetical protein